MIVTCIDNDLAELSSLEELCLISRRSSWLDEVVDEVQSCTSALRFLRMFFWSVLTLDDTDDDRLIKDILTIVNDKREVYWGKSRKVAPFPLVSTRNEYDGWIRDLQRRIQDSKKIFQESCEHLLLHGSLRCNSLKKKNTGKFLHAILENLKDLHKYKSDDVSVLFKKLTLLHHLFELTPKEWRSFEEMQEFKVVVHDFAHYSACLVFMYWVKATDEGTTTKMNLLVDVLQKYKPYVPALKAFYGRFLKEMKSQFDPLFLGRIIQVFLDLLLENLVVPISNEDFQILQESLMFVIAFLASPPDQYSDPKELMMITNKIEVLVEEDLYLVLSVDETEENLDAFMWKVELAKGDIRLVYNQIQDSFSYDIPKISGLGFFDFLLQNLGFLKEKLKKDTDFIPCAKHVITEIEEELMSMRPYLDDLFQLQKEDEILQDTWSRVIDLAYQSEYAINSCMVTGNALWYNIAGLMEVLDKLKDVNSNLKKIEGRKTHDGAILRSSNRVPEGPLASSFNEVMVGLEEEADNIIENLIYGSDSLDIVAIVGMPGIGKTTMANKVYNAPAVRNHFHAFAYCIVSQDFSTRRILLDILGDIRGKDDKIYDMSEEDLARRLYNYLLRIRYLIIMDDIWDVKCWNAIKSSLPDNQNGSRVIFTTRNGDVALKAKKDCILHPIRPLSDEESWELLEKKAFQAEKGCPPDYLEVGKMIAKKCKGLPLAVVLIAGLLRRERSLHWWYKICKAIEGMHSKKIMSVIEFSYQHLPEHLKPCFLYLGSFVENAKIRVNNLMVIWIAEGFVLNSKGENLENVARECLNDLVDRSLVIANERSSYGGIKSCRIHDLVHEFCQKKAQEENFFQLMVNKEASGSISSSFNEVMVGLEEEADTIVENLINGSKSLDIVAIVGMPGIGKTTMANKVYNAHAVRNHFHVFGYCIVSQVYSARRILLDILGDIIGENDNNMYEMTEEDLAHMLRRCLLRERYLIVMDDIWDIKSWDELKGSLPNNQNGSRVIFTTRNRNVALLAKEDCILHHLRFLSHEESWELLWKKAFQAESCPPDFLEVGKMIANNCKGLPLTIVSIAELIAKFERSVSKWNSISEAVGSSVLMEDSMRELELSYHHLPEHLKPCFLYFGAFAEDRLICVNKLMLLWIAEGFIQKSNMTNLENVARGYLCDLVDRSLVIPDEKSSYGGIKSCRIHDLVHEFCQVKAQEENFFQLIDGNKAFTSPSSPIHKPYRVCIHMKGKYPKEAPKICPNIHSLLSTAVHDAGNLKLVQVMDLKDLTRWGNFKPVHLRFLAGPTIPGARIPYSISNLWNLQFLILTGTSVLELPETFWKMTKLIHVDVGQCRLSKSRAEKGEVYPQMVNLESFSSPTVYSTKDLEEVLQRSPSLIKLSFHYEYEEELEKISHTLIYNEPRRNFHFPSLDSISKLESLKVSSSKELRLHPFEFPSTLKKLTLLGGSLPWGYLPVISEMPCLEVLKLLSNAFAGPKWDMEDAEFGKLKFLKLDGLELAEWIAYVESFPSLEVLTVSRCNYLDTIPLCFEEMAPLERIEVLGSRRAATSVVETHETVEQIPLEEMTPLRGVKVFGLRKAATEVVETHETAEQIPLEEMVIETHETEEQIPLEEMTTLKRIEVSGLRKAASEVVGIHETAEQIPLEEMATLKRIEVLGSHKAATKVHETEEIVLENLIDFIHYNINLIGGRLDDNIKKVVDDLHLLKPFARGYSKIDTNSDAFVQKVANDVRDVVYQAEDAFEDYIIYQTLKKNRGVGSKALRLFGFSGFSDFKQIGEQLQVVSANVTLLMEKMSSIGLEALKDAAGAAAPYKRVKNKKVQVAEEDDVVGFEDEAEKVIKLLTDGEAQELEIISIIGMLGLGKTTLAKKVLSDPKVEYDFFYSVFVNVSREYERREVFIKILGALKCKLDRDMADDEEIIKKLREELDKYKYLIVLDDVWDEGAWDDLKVAFPNNKKGSRVLITSRHMRVASHANPSTNAHELRFMTVDESRELLRRKVFEENERPHQIERYEVHILKICGGLPLAIVAVAGILWNHRERTEWWEKVAESVGDYVARDQSHLNDMINLSLEHLAYQKKKCFLYLGVFREEFEIPVWKLLRLWIAEGYIQKDRGMTLEDIAEEYLQDLVDRSLVIVVSRRSNGQIKTCRIHDIFRDFCKKEALKQNMFQDVKVSDQSALQSCRRICVNSDVINHLASKPTGGRVRSFLTFAKEETALPVKLVSSIPRAFGRLRVLDAKPLKFPHFPAKLVDLVLLKYIAMSIDFKMIPQSFSNLINLQTVIIDTTSGTLEIKADISKLALLRHLQTNAAASLEEGKASVANPNLQTLCTISPESCTAELFERYPKLKKLGIRGKLAIIILDNGEFSFFDALAKLEFLENLKLINDDTSRLHVLPRETSFPRNLRRLTLMNTFLGWSQISTVGKLQKLEVLKLKDNAFDGEIWNTEDGGFRCLKVLHIVNTQKLVSWRADAIHFPKLTTLYLRHCANLEAIPHGFAHIPSLHTIDLYRCTKPSVVASAQKIQDFKFQQAQQKNNKTSQFKLTVYPPDQLELHPTASFSGPSL